MKKKCFQILYKNTCRKISLKLAELFYSDDKKHCGNAFLFSKLIEKFKFLQEGGIALNLSEGAKRVYFKLALTIGDNLGLNSIFGLVECFNANFL